MKQITGVLIDVDQGTAAITTLDASLDAYYRALNCTCIDIVARRIGGRRKAFEVICDDEGTFKDAPKISAIDNMGSVMLVGSLFITGYVDDEGELTSLSKEDADYIMQHIQKQSTRIYREPYPMLHQCAYC